MQSEEARPLERKSEIAVWMLPALIFFANGGIYGTWATQVPIVKARIGLNDAEFGILLMAMGIGAVSSMILSGWLLPRFGTSRLIIFNFAGFVASLLGLAFSSSVPVFTIALLLFGASGGLMDVAMNAYAAEIEKEIGRPVMSSIHGMWNVGGLAGAGFGGFLLQFVNGHLQAGIVAAALVLMFIPVASRLTPAPIAQSKSKRARTRHGYTVWLMGGLAALAFAAEGSVRDWSSLFLNVELHLPLALAGWAFAVFSALMAFGRLTGDIGRRLWGDRLVIVSSGIIAAIGLGMATNSASTGAIFAGFALAGLGMSNIVPTIISSAGRLQNPAASITIVVAMGYSGYLASPPILGALVSATSLSSMFECIGGICLVIAACWFVQSLFRR